jgi:glutathione S-transferase
MSSSSITTKMSSQEVPSDIILFHYTFSPFAKRIVWYLKLRGIPYAECIQPLTLPRPDLAELGINYRRIPLLSIGRDVYYDTRLILARLEQSFPASSSYPPLSTPDNKGLEALLEKFTVDAGIFSKAAQSLPPDLPTMKDEKFVKDRAEFTGTSWSQEARVKGYPEALAHIRHAFGILEALLADGRQWIGGTDKISLADIHGEFDVSRGANQRTDESSSCLAFHLDWRYAPQGVVLQGSTSQDMGMVGPLQEDDQGSGEVIKGSLIRRSGCNATHRGCVLPR